MRPYRILVCPGTEGHGTANDYHNHGCRCPEARKLYQYERKTPHLRPYPLVPSLGARRRIRALQAIGWTGSEIARRLGRVPAGRGNGLGVLMYDHKQEVVSRLTDQKVRAIYDELKDTPGPSVRTKGWAKKFGHLPPSAWVDIDDPEEQPDAVLPAVGFDAVVVERAVKEAMLGEDVRSKLSLAEKAVAARKVLELGLVPTTGKRLIGEGKGIKWVL